MNVGHDIIHEIFGSAPRTGCIWATGRQAKPAHKTQARGLNAI